MAFGVIASPFLLTATIKHHLRQNPNDFAEKIEEDLYADNLVSFLPKTIDAEQFYKTTKNSFAEMGMNITKWTTDDPQLRKKFADTDLVTEADQTVLGIHWNTKNRNIRIKKPNIPNEVEIVTKRKALQEMASVFDPLGWVSPIVLKAKLYIRKIWLNDYTWDKQLPKDLTREWNSIRQNLRSIDEINLPRAYAENGIEEAQRIELHAFCDASALAYGVVIYLTVHHQSTSWTGIVASKTRLAPKRELSIPRLELLAAVIAAKYLDYVHRELKIENSDKYLWGDLRCVISWVASKKILPAIVEKAARVITETGIKKFMYVPTTQNPADVASRGATIEELNTMKWWNGPNWLNDS